MASELCARTRVAPVLNWLLVSDPTGRAWLARLMALPARAVPPGQSPPADLGKLTSGRWWPQPARIDAAQELMDLAVEQFEQALQPDDGAGATTPREDLHRVEPWLRHSQPVEPAAVLSTNRFLAVVEGRRSAPGEHIDVAREVEGLVRTLDAALSDRRAREVACVLIVEGCEPTPEEVPAPWNDVARLCIDGDLLVSALPHRHASARDAIAAAFRGVMTWQRVCRSLEIPWSALPGAVCDVAPGDADWCGGCNDAAGAPRPVTIGRHLDEYLERHRQALADSSRPASPPLTLTDAARTALASFYDSPAWRRLHEAARAGNWPARRTVTPLTPRRRWTFVLGPDARLNRLVQTHAELLDGTWDEAVEDALERFYRRE